MRIDIGKKTHVEIQKGMMGLFFEDINLDVMN